ncbi:hypothetical protein BJX70DRAFT_169194 [Aspergillus crustosus]
MAPAKSSRPTQTDNNHRAGGSPNSPVRTDNKKKKRLSRNDKRQLISQPDTPPLGESRHILRSVDGHPDIIIEDYKSAKDFASAAHCSSTELFLWVDGSFSASLEGRIAPASCSQSPPSSLSPKRSAAGASVVYQTENGEWKNETYGLPGARGWQEAEIHRLNLGLQKALTKVQNDPELRKIVIFSDCQGALESLVKHIARAVERSKVSMAAKQAFFKAKQLRQLGISLELRWVPAHMKVAGNIVADMIAKNASHSTACLSESRAKELDGTAQLLENPYRIAAY